MDPGPITFARREDHRVVAGVAGGFADQHGVDRTLVRAALVVLSFAAGLGVVLYAVGYLLSTSDGVRLPPAHPPDARRNVAVVCIVTGVLLVLRTIGLWLGDPVMVPVVVVAAGVVLLGMRRSPHTLLADVVAGRHARSRMVAGAVLVAIGLVVAGTRSGVSSGVRVGTIATAITIVGVALLIGPWLARLAQEVAQERRQRIRSEEREAMAAHLHDSVLQTLALIQRSADDPRRTVTLARRQEQELRAWLYGPREAPGETVAAAIRAVVQEVEALYDVRVDLVVVGDVALPVDDRLAALVAATREACVNAAKHSGVDELSVFVEAAPDRVEAFVRDRGRGFDDVAPSPGRGIADSIRTRMERAGGGWSIDTAPGRGTEVHLVLPMGADAPAEPRS